MKQNITMDPEQLERLVVYCQKEDHKKGQGEILFAVLVMGINKRQKSVNI